jgi:hypothetical protein
MKFPTDTSGSPNDRMHRIVHDLTDRQRAIFAILDSTDSTEVGEVLMASLFLLGVSYEELNEVCDIGLYVDGGITNDA